MASSQDLRIRYIGDASQLQRTVSTIDKAHQDLASKIKAAGAKITSAGKSLSLGLTLPLVGIGKLAIDEFGEAMRVTEQTQAVLKSTGNTAGVTADHVAGLAERLGRLSAQEDETIQAGANMLLTFTNIRNEAGKGNKIFDQSVRALTDVAAAMGTDPKQAAVQLGKALNDPVKGITALTRVGVSFTEQQKSQIASMVKHGDVAGAQKLILAELNKEFGGSAKAAGKAATPTQKLALLFKDMAEKIGEVLVPMLKGVVEWVGKVVDWFKNLSPEAQQNAVKIGVLAAAIGPLLIVLGKLVTAFGTVMKAAKALFSFIGKNPYVLIIAATVALVILIVKNWDKIKEFIFKVWNKIKEVAAAIWGKIKEVLLGIWNAIKGAVVSTFNTYKAIIVGVWQAIKTVTLTIWTTIKTVTTNIWNAIKAVVTGVWNGIKTVASTVWSGIKTVIINPILALKDLIGDALQWIQERWALAWTTMKSAMGNIWDGIVQGLKWGVNQLIALLNGVVKGLNLIIRGTNILNPFEDIPYIPEIPYLARGGHIVRSGLAVVGERGPELVSLPRGAQVHSASASQAMLSGGMTVVVNVHGSVTSERDLAETIRRELLRAGRRNAGQVGLA